MDRILDSLSGTITPWLLATFFTLSLVALLAAFKNWREMKRSPYFFQRLQAGKRLQTYLTSSAILIIISFLVTAYAWEDPQQEPLMMAILPNSKPVLIEEVEADTANVAEIVEDAAPSSIQEDVENPGQLVIVSDQPFVATQPELPEEFDRYEPTVDLLEASELGKVDFSTEVTEDYEAVDPREIFAEGFFTLYATFSYEGLADGMVWSWVWRHNGEVIEGGNEVWAYGDEGPGYIYLEPEEGFEAGRYSLEIWINDELMAQSSAVMNSAITSANN